MKRKSQNKPRRSELKSFTLDSISAVQDFAKFSPERIKHIECPEGLVAEFEKLGLHPQVRSKGIKAEVSVEALTDVDLFLRLEEECPIILALDHVTDPRNLGAIVRSASFFGVPYVLAPKDRQVGLTPASVATAQGGFALTHFVSVTNLSRTLEKLKEKGYWVIGTDFGGEDVETVIEKGFEKVVLVLGSEDKGLSQNVSRCCDLKTTITGATKAIQSLNVSVAAGILLQRWSEKK